MFEQLREVNERLEEIVRLLSDADTAKDAARLQSLMKEQANLTPVSETYNAWKKMQETIEDCQEMLSSEKDEDMPCRRGRRRSCPVCRAGIPHVSSLRGSEWLESGTDKCQREWTGRLQGMCLSGQWKGRVLTPEI